MTARACLGLIARGDGTSMTELHDHDDDHIKAPVQEVWNAIADRRPIERWFFGVKTETDWKPGSPIVHRGEWRKPYEDKGGVVRVEPPTLLVHPTGRNLGRARYSRELRGGHVVTDRAEQVH